MNPARSSLYYGWYIVGVAFIANFLAVGTNFYIFNAFMEPLAERGFDRVDVNRALTIGTIAGFFIQVIYGTVVMKTGPRLLMTLGGILSGASFIGMGQVHDIRLFYALYILLFCGNSALAGIVAGTAVNNWFVMKRGRAMGIATAGMSLTGVVIPPLAMALVKWTSLETAFTIIGSSLLISSPLAWAVIRNRPEDHGLLPDGDTPLLTPAEGGAVSVWGPRQLVRTGAFYTVGISYSLLMMGVVGVMSQLKPRFTDIGYADGIAMQMMAATALLGAAGKYVWGMLCDRFSPSRVAGVMMLACAGGMALGLMKDSHSAQLAFVVIFGFAMGGAMSTYPILVAHFYGRESFASAGRFFFLFLVFQVAGYYLMGKSTESTGSYDFAYALFLAFDIVAAVLVFATPRPRLNHSTSSTSASP